jgi:FkbM family methyltransferase
MRKLLYITPHLSTGGAPQYLLKKIELLKEEYDISLVEYNDIGGIAFVVQKNKIFDIIPPEKRITLGEDKTQLLDFLDKVQPDIVHLEEIPEMFMDRGVAEILYDKNRKYTIFETSHDSSQNPNNKQFFPDKFMFVSNWQIDQYKDIDVPAVLVEYPIEYKENRNRTAACERLGLDPNKKHIIHVGLFTPRKNQAEFFEYAHALPEYEFHCIGNQADNFRHYWEPLMKNKPNNLTWWGERKDVDNFYEAADLFLFTSKGNSHDKETMPLVIREALSWQLPILIYNLEVYQNYFDNYPVTYLTNKEQNIKNIKNIMEGFEIVSSPITANDFDISFEGENKINFSYKKAEKFDCKIVVKEKYSNAPMYWFDASFQNYISWWCIPNSNSSIKDSWVTELTLEFYSPEKRFLFSKEAFVKENGIKPDIKLDLANPFDCLFHNYDEMFVEKKYDFLFKTKLNTVLDIGANAGTFSKLFLENGVSKIYAFEPNQDALVNLNYLASKEPNLKVIEKAVHTNEEDLKFYIDKGNTTIGSFDSNHVNLNNNAEVKEIIVPTITLQNFIKQENLSKIDLIKIDIEGAEYNLIEHLTDPVFDITDRFLIEWHNNTDQRVQKLVDKLISKGYSLTKIFNQNSKEDLTDSYQDSTIGTFIAEKQYKVTVIIPTYNHESYIEQCVNSVLAQQTSFPFNILISDDCSNDNTFKIIQQYKNLPNVIIHQTPSNEGPTHTRTHNLYKMCSSNYVTLLDGDDYLTDPYKLQKQVDFLNSNPEYIIHSMGCSYTSPEGIEESTIYYSLKEEITDFKENLEANWIGFGFMFRNILDWNNIPDLPYEKHSDCRWVDNILLLQKGKGKNEKWSGGSYRITPKGQFGIKSHEEKVDLNKEWVKLNKQFFLSSSLEPKPIIIVDTFFHDSNVKTQLNKFLSFIKKLDLPLMLVTNSEFDSSLTKEFDYILYDSNNRLFKEEYDSPSGINFWFQNAHYKFSISSKGDQPHGLSVLSNLYHSTNLAKSLGYTHFYRIEADCFIENLEAVKNIINQVKTEDKKGYGYINGGKYFSFQIFYMELDYFTQNFPQINNEKDYQKSISNWVNKNWLSAEEFITEMVRNSPKGENNLILKDAPFMWTDFGNCMWNTVTTPIESDQIINGVVASLFRITNNPSQLALITWNASTEGLRNAKYKITFPNGEIKNFTHNIQGINSHHIDIIDLQKEDIQINIEYADITTTYLVNIKNISNLIYNFITFANENLPS